MERISRTQIPNQSAHSAEQTSSRMSAAQPTTELPDSTARHSLREAPGSGTRWRCRLCGRVMCMAKGAHSQAHKCAGGYRKRFGKAARQRGWDNCFERCHGDDPITVTAPCRPCGTDSAASTPELEPGECNHNGQSAGGCDRDAVFPNDPAQAGRGNNA
jgi:hypothetical protein